MACEANNPPKTGNTRKKMVFFSQATPIFLPKRPQKGPFFAVSTFLIQALAIFGIDGEELALISGIRPFWGEAWNSLSPSGRASSTAASRLGVEGSRQAIALARSKNRFAPVAWNCSIASLSRRRANYLANTAAALSKPPRYDQNLCRLDSGPVYKLPWHSTCSANTRSSAQRARRRRIGCRRLYG